MKTKITSQKVVKGRTGQTKRRSARLSMTSVNEISQTITTRVTRSSYAAVKKVLTSGEKKTSKKRKVVTMEESNVTTSRRRRRVSSTPTLKPSKKKKIQNKISTTRSGYQKTEEPETSKTSNGSSVVTPCKSKKRHNPSSHVKTISIRTSPTISCTSSHSFKSNSSQATLPEKIINIDEDSLQHPKDYPYHNHNSDFVLNKSFMRDYGRDHFYNLSLREESETAPPASCSTMRITRSKRHILSSDSSCTSSISYYESSSSSSSSTLQGRKKPVIRHPSFNYMINQPYLSYPMRTLLIDWFVELSEEYKIKPETLHLAVKILDRVLSKAERRTKKERKAYKEEMERKREAKYEKNYYDSSQSEDSDDSSDEEDEDKRYSHKGFVVKRHMLQCVGCACMLIATKLEELKAPAAKDFAYISDSTYTTKQIIKMEMKICTHLSFRLREVTPMMFFHRFIRASQEGDSKPPNEVLETLCLYILELGLLEYELVGVKSSLIMASALYIARATLGIRSESSMKNEDGDTNTSVSARRVGEFWSPTLEYYTGYEMWELEHVVSILHSLQLEAEERKDNLKSVFIKYKSTKYLRVALKTVLRKGDLGFTNDVNDASSIVS